MTFISHMSCLDCQSMQATWPLLPAKTRCLQGSEMESFENVCIQCKICTQKKVLLLDDTWSPKQRLRRAWYWPSRSAVVQSIRTKLRKFQIKILQTKQRKNKNKNQHGTSSQRHIINVEIENRFSFKHNHFIFFSCVLRHEMIKYWQKRTGHLPCVCSPLPQQWYPQPLQYLPEKSDMCPHPHLLPGSWKQKWWLLSIFLSNTDVK